MYPWQNDNLVTILSLCRLNSEKSRQNALPYSSIYQGLILKVKVYKNNEEVVYSKYEAK